MTVALYVTTAMTRMDFMEQQILLRVRVMQPVVLTLCFNFFWNIIGEYATSVDVAENVTGGKGKLMICSGLKTQHNLD